MSVCGSPVMITTFSLTRSPVVSGVNFRISGIAGLEGEPAPSLWPILTYRPPDLLQCSYNLALVSSRIACDTVDSHRSSSPVDEHRLVLRQRSLNNSNQCNIGKDSSSQQDLTFKIIQTYH